MVNQVMDRQSSTGSNPIFLEKARAQASDLKQQEAVASQQRMQVLEDIDQKREQAQTEAQEARRKEERRTITILLLVSAIFILFVITITIWNLVLR